MLGNKGLNTGKWRTHSSPMQVVSGSIGKETVHFEPPPSKIVPQEMEQFILWFNATTPGKPKEIRNPLIRAALVHLYFESIHPFEDGNGRIGRALSEKALSQGLGYPALLSLSSAIEDKKDNYYKALKIAQHTKNLTNWLQYFQTTVMEAQEMAKELVEFSLTKTKFFDKFSTLLNERQLKVIKRMLEEGINGFQGGMNAKKYMTIAKTSKATATRDLQSLTELRIFIPSGGGRSVRYQLDIIQS